MALEAENYLPAAEGIQFGKAVTYQASGQFDLAVSDDGLALTATYSGMQAQIGNKASGAPVAAKMSSFVVPLTGHARGVDLRFKFQGHVLTTSRASGHIVCGVNEKTLLVDMASHMDESFMHELNYQAGRASEVRVNVFLFVENDSQAEDFGASLTLSAIDATVGDPIV
jgi:hypothetical protein